MYNLKWYNIFSLVKIRKEQLDDEKKIDKIITNIKTTCPETLVNYMLKHRELNRVLSNKLYNADFYEYPEIFTDGISVVKEQYSKVLLISNNTLLTNKEKCQCFQIFTLAMDVAIKKNK